MKVMAFNARPDERAFFDHFSQSLNMDLTLQKDTLTLDNVALTRGYDGISCTCDLPAPILEKLAENGVRYVIFIWLLYRFSVIYMAFFYFMIGPMFDFLYLVMIYAVFVNRMIGVYDSRKGKEVWKWS